MKTKYGWLATVVATTILMVGCSNERYFCNDDGCFYCDGFGCRDADYDYPRCDFGYQCQEGESCTSLGCVRTCSADTDCPEGTTCRFETEGQPGQCLCPDDDFPTDRPDECQGDHSCGDGFCATSGECLADDGTNCDADHPCGGGMTCRDFRCVDGADVADGGVPVDDGGTNTDDGGATTTDEAGPLSDGSTAVDGVDGGSGNPNNGGDPVRPDPQCSSDSACESMEDYGPGWKCVDALCVLPCLFNYECGADCDCVDGYCTEPQSRG